MESIMDKTLLLNPGDYVGVSFWIISAAMVAATFFFWVERDRAVVNGSFSDRRCDGYRYCRNHYFYMREVWVGITQADCIPLCDWLLTVPLQIGEFYLILAAMTAVASCSGGF